MYLAGTTQEGMEKIEKTLSDGTALNKFREMLIKQGVSTETAAELCNGDCYTSVIPKAKYVTTYATKKDGVVKSINAADIAVASWYLGAGRSQSGDSIDHAVGIKLLKLVGDKVAKGEKWIEVHHSQTTIHENIKKLIENSLYVEHVEKYSKRSRIIKTF